jgi:hypothetical protein
MLFGIALIFDLYKWYGYEFIHAYLGGLFWWQQVAMQAKGEICMKSE